MPRSPHDSDYLHQQYLPSMTVPDAEALLQDSARRSANVRKRLDGELNLPYGDSPGQVLDIFPGSSTDGPVFIFIHGGYWRASHVTRSVYSHIAAPLVKAGATVVMPDYDLCPDVRISDISMQIQQMMRWVYHNIQSYRGDPNRIHVAGHSAGGQLTGMLMSTDWGRYTMPADLIKGTVMLSGLFDIEPHRHTALQKDIRLTADEANAMSPLKQSPHYHGSSILAVGENEPDLFHWQSLQYAAYLRQHHIRAEYLSTPDDNHFTITDRLGRASDALTKLVIRRLFAPAGS